MELSVFLFSAALFASVPQGSNEVARAYLKQSGLDKDLKQLEQEYVSNSIRIIAVDMFMITNICVNKRLTLQWSF